MESLTVNNFSFKLSTSVLCTLVLLGALSFSVLCASDDEYEGFYSLTVEHSFEQGLDPVFQRRGVVAVRSLKSGVAEFSEQASLSEEQKTALKDAVMADGFYRVRVGKNNGSEPPSSYVYSFIKACALYESRMNDQLTIHVDHAGNLIAASIVAPVPYCTGQSVHNEELTQFNTDIDIQQTILGPAPETQAYIQKLEQEKKAKEQGQQADNRGFFAKYWMYIVPVLIFMMVMQNMDPNAAGQGAARS